MITTEYPSPKIEIELFDAAFSVSANSHRELSFVTDHVVVNRIPLEVRAYVAQNSNGHWQAKNIFAYRLDNEGNRSFGASATSGQQSKLYRALVEAAEELPAKFLLDGQDAAVGRDIERLEREIEELKIKVGEKQYEKRVLTLQIEASVLADFHV